MNRWFASLLAISLILPVLSSAQQPPANADDNSVASYIKEWRWESIDGKSAIDMSSSSLMLFDGSLYDYGLSGGELRFLSGGKAVPYRYDPAKDHVTFEFSDTSRIEYHRTIQSVLARRGTRRLPEDAEFLFGRFATAGRRSGDGASEQKIINFHANTEFDFGPRGSTNAGGAAGGSGSPAALGTALVYGDVIIFSFYDSSAAEAGVETRESRGDLRSFVYADETYARAPQNASLYPAPTPYPVPEPYPDPPPVYPYPPLDPPYYPPYYPPIYYPHYHPRYYPGVILHSPIPHHAGGGGGERGHGEPRSVGTHRSNGSGNTGTRGSSGRSSGGSSRGSSGGSSGGRGGSSSSGSSRGGSRR